MRNGPKLKNSLMRIDTVSHIYSLTRVGVLDENGDLSAKEVTAGDAGGSNLTSTVIVSSTHDLLVSEGYWMTEDAWRGRGRRTYIHDDDATRSYFVGLTRRLRSAGWEVDRNNIRSLRHRITNEIIELESGGAGTTGHFLHHMKSLNAGRVTKIRMKW